MARPRNYAAEYARRVPRNLARGFTRSQARGHPRRTERLVSEPAPTAAPEYRPPADDRIYNALERVAQGQSLERAARAEISARSACAAWRTSGATWTRPTSARGAGSGASILAMSAPC
jgi:hypothetical protein